MIRRSGKVLAIVLSIMMMLTAVLTTGCSKEANSDESEKSGIVTLNMFILTEEETTPSAARDVQMKINEITVPQYKMLVKINYVTPEAYWEAVDKAEAETISYSKNKSAYGATVTGEADENAPEAENNAEATENAEAVENTEAEATVGGVDDTEVEVNVKKSISEMSFNEAIDYVFEIDDVELDHPQLDVFVVDDYAKFVEMVEEERLSEIDIKYERKALTKYIHPTIFTSATVGGKTYGIPANFKINGKYEFLVFNKNLLDKYGYSVHDLKKIEDMGEYLALIKQNEPGYYPISDIPELSGAEMFDDILFAISDLSEVSTASLPVYLNNSIYMDYLKTTASYRQNGYVASFDGVKNAKYAVEFVEADSLIEREWTDENGVTYQSYLYDIPRVKTEDAFSSAMCVSAYSMNKAKASELIELFNTDSQLANLLQYGIEGRHYRVDENDVVTFIDSNEEDIYRMNNFVTGNTYIKYVTEGNEDYIDFSKASNLSAAPSAYFGYKLDFEDLDSEAIYDCVKTFSAEALKRMENGEMSIDEAFNIASKQLNALGCVWNDNGSALLGVFGKLASKQEGFAKQNTAFFVASKEAMEYNDVYKSAEEIAAELAAEEAAKEAEQAEKEAAEQAALEARIAAENAKNAAENQEGEEADLPEEDETAE